MSCTGWRKTFGLYKVPGPMFTKFFHANRSWCPDRVLPQALKYISESMGVKFAEGVILNVEDMWMESNIRVPMICFLSMGSDPTNTIDMLSRKHNISKSSCM